MLGLTRTTPKTVAEALAPFKKAMADLKNVVSQQNNQISEAARDSANAKKAYEHRVASNSGVIAAATAEVQQATSVLVKLQDLLDPTPAVPITTASGTNATADGKA